MTILESKSLVFNKSQSITFSIRLYILQTSTKTNLKLGYSLQNLK